MKTIHFKSGATMEIDQSLFESITDIIEKHGTDSTLIVRDEEALKGENRKRPNRFINISEIAFID